MSSSVDLLEQASRLIKAWDDWEGAVILDQASWFERGGFRVTGQHYRRYIELQEQRRVVREALAVHHSPSSATIMSMEQESAL